MQFTLTTDRLLLKVLDESQADLTLAFFKDYAEYFQPFETPYSENFLTRELQASLLQAEEALILKGTQFRYWAFLKEDPNKIIGTVSFRNIQPYPVNDCEIGYKLIPECQHRGLASEMLRTTLPLVISDYRLHRIYAHVTKDNLPSLRLLDSFGFVREGSLRQAFLSTEGRKDVELYALLASDYSLTA